MKVAKARLARAAVAGLAAAGISCGELEREGPAEWCPEPPGVLTVVNRGEGAWSGGRVGFEELWRAGGLAEDEELAFPVGIAAAPGGRTAVPDWVLGQVIVVEADGTWSGPWTRPGEGPGEVRRPVAAAWTGEGRLAVFDLEGPRVVYAGGGEPEPEDVPVDPDFTGPILAGGSLAWAGVRPDGTVLLLPPPARPEGAGPEERALSVLLALPPGAEAPDTLARAAVPTLQPIRDEPAPGWPRVLAAVAGDLLAVAAADGSYRIDVYGPGSTHLRRVCRDAVGFPLRPDETGEATGPGQHYVQDRIRGAPRPPAPAPIGRIVLGVGGRLWVERERPSPLGREEAFYGRPSARFDVFDAEGRYLGEVETPEGARLQAAAGDTLWALEFGEHDETSVVAYRLVTG